jgi:hypothetical protein
VTGEPCALCGATWGGHRRVVQGDPLNFCCGACGEFYQLSIDEVREATAWPRVDRLFLDEIDGTDASGWAEHGGHRVRFDVSGLPDGSQVTRFALRPASGPSPGGSS